MSSATEETSWLRRLGTIDTQRAPTEAQGPSAENAVATALRALAAGEAATAKRTSYLGCSLDADGAYAGLTGLVERAIGDIETAGAVQEGTWRRIATLLGPGPLADVVSELSAA